MNKECSYEIFEHGDGQYEVFEENIIDDAYSEIEEKERIERILEKIRKNFHEKILVVIGTQWGDESKGKLVDLLAHDYDIIARGNGGSNAGHTVVVGGKQIICHLISSGVLHPNKDLLIGDNCVVNVEGLVKEMEELESFGISFYKKEGENKVPRFHLSNRVAITFNLEKMIDSILESRKERKKVGTTGRGIGPTYSALADRYAVRMQDLLLDEESFRKKFWDHYNMCVKSYPELLLKINGKNVYTPHLELDKILSLKKKILPFIEDTVSYLNKQYKEGKKILLEGANGAMLDRIHGTYPEVTSSDTTSGGLASGVGIAPNKLTTVIGVVKAYTTRVGEGPFPSEGGVPIESNDSKIHGTYSEGQIGNYLREKGKEFGATTGRPRRCGWLDIQQLKYSFTINGITEINLSKLDVLTGLKEIKIITGYIVDGKEIDFFPENIDELIKSGRITFKFEKLQGWNESIKNCTTFEDLPENTKNYIKRIEELLGLPATTIGVGSGRENTIVKNLGEVDLAKKKLRESITHHNFINITDITSSNSTFFTKTKVIL